MDCGESLDKSDVVTDMASEKAGNATIISQAVTEKTPVPMSILPINTHPRLTIVGHALKVFMVAALLLSGFGGKSWRWQIPWMHISSSRSDSTQFK